MIRLGNGGLAVRSETELLFRALALSVAVGRPFVWEGFRTEDSPSGFLPEEAAAILAFGRLAGSITEGGAEGGTTLGFEPSVVEPLPARLELSPRSTLLPFLRAASLPLAVRARDVSLRLTGSTHAPGGDTYEGTESTWCHLVRELGVDIGVTLHFAGFVPKGRGEVGLRVAAVPPESWRACRWLSRGEPGSLRIVSAGASVPVHVQQRQAARARSGVGVAGVTPNVQLVKLAAGSAGSTVAITGLFDGLPITFAAVSDRGKSSEAVGDEAAARFRRYAKQAAVVPAMFVGSLLPFLCFAEGSSRLTTPELGEMLESEVALARVFTGREIRIEGHSPGPVMVVVESRNQESLQT